VTGEVPNEPTRVEGQPQPQPSYRRWWAKLKWVVGGLGVLFAIAQIPHKATGVADDAKRQFNFVHDEWFSSHADDLSAERIGNYEFTKDSRISAAIDALGRPSSLKRTSYDESHSSCFAEWKKVGVSATFYMVYEDACKNGFLCEAAIDESMNGTWETKSGLTFGDSIERMRQLYPAAKRLPVGGNLQMWKIEDGTTTCAGFPLGPKKELSGLYAQTYGDSVSNFYVYYYDGPVD
jgi:hypothetical protein